MQTENPLIALVERLSRDGHGRLFAQRSMRDGQISGLFEGEVLDYPGAVRAMLGHASQNVTQDYIHIDEALKLAVRRTSDEIERLLAEGAAKSTQLQLAA